MRVPPLLQGASSHPRLLPRLACCSVQMLRVDAAGHMSPDFLPGYVNASTLPAWLETVTVAEQPFEQGATVWQAGVPPWRPGRRQLPAALPSTPTHAFSPLPSPCSAQQHRLQLPVVDAVQRDAHLLCARRAKQRPRWLLQDPVGAAPAGRVGRRPSQHGHLLREPRHKSLPLRQVCRLLPLPPPPLRLSLLPPPMQASCRLAKLTVWACPHVCRADLPAYRNALAYTLLSEAIPIM